MVSKTLTDGAGWIISGRFRDCAQKSLKQSYNTLVSILIAVNEPSPSKIEDHVFTCNNKTQDKARFSLTSFGQVHFEPLLGRKGGKRKTLEKKTWAEF